MVRGLNLRYPVLGAISGAALGAAGAIGGTFEVVGQLALLGDSSASSSGASPDSWASPYWPPPDANIVASVVLWAATLAAAIAFGAVIVRRADAARAAAEQVDRS